MFEFISYQFVLSVHITAFVWNVTWVVISDFVGLLWLLGKIQTLNQRFIKSTHWFVWGGITLSILSGTYLFSQSSEYLLTVPAFYTKMAFLIALVINSFFIGRHIELVVTKTFRETTKDERSQLFISAAVSTLSWVGVVVAAQYLGL